MQLRVGSVAVINGDTVVRGLHAVVLTGVTGSAFAEAELVTWGVDGAGVVARHDTVASRLYFYRTSGALPAITNTVRNSGSTKTGVISSFTSDTAPNFSTELSGPGGPKLFSALGTGLVYSVASASTDNITLTGAYAGDTDREIGYTITRDYSLYFAWPVPAPSDIDLASILARLFSLIDATLYGVAMITPTLGTNWTHGAASQVRYHKDADRVVHLSGFCLNAVGTLPTAATIFTLPVGYRPFYAKRFAIIVSGTTTTGVLEITTGGAVNVLVGTISSSVYLDGINFRAEA